MADVSQLEINGTTYNICDATARDSLSQYCPFPVGAVYLTFDNSDPATIWTGTTWTQIAAGTFLVASGTNYNLRTTGGAASVTLTAAQSGVPAHAHGLNSHKHSIGAHAHGLNSHTHTLSSHTHKYDKPNTPTGSTKLTAAQSGVPAHDHKGYVYYGSTPPSDVTATTGSGLNYNYTNSKHVGITKAMFNGGIEGGAKAASQGHTHTIGTTSTASAGPSNNTSGAASGNTADSTAFDSGAASGNTANNTAANANSAHENRPPYIAVAMWERTA